MPKMRSNDVLADHRAGTSGFRFADFRMPEMLRHRNLRGVDFPRNKCLYRASLAGSRAASALAFGISGNTAASIAMTASRFLGNGCGNRGLLQIMRTPNPSEVPFSSKQNSPVCVDSAVHLFYLDCHSEYKEPRPRCPVPRASACRAGSLQSRPAAQDRRRSRP
jgi:hypothetical protein